MYQQQQTLIYCLPRYQPDRKGLIADVTILGYTRDIDNFRRNLPVRKYYLVDASYILLDITLIPYLGGVWYYLKEQLQPIFTIQRSSRQQADLCLVDIKELFNLQHLSLRSIYQRSILAIIKQHIYALYISQQYCITLSIVLILKIYYLRTSYRVQNEIYYCYSGITYLIRS